MSSWFSSTSTFDSDVEKATSPKKTDEDWALILEICDKVGKNPPNAKDCLKAISKRLFASDPHIVLHAITLLDACSTNCGKVFHLEVASRSFEQILKKLITTNRSNNLIYKKLKVLIKKWAENDYKSDPQLNLIPSLYEALKIEGHDFFFNDQVQQFAPVSTLNTTSYQEEEEEIAKAIELSLKENTPQLTSPDSSNFKKSLSLYPSFNSNAIPVNTMAEKRKVLALYDFEAAEDNELSFKAGEIIYILDDSDPNWWKGSTNKGEGLFPSNFVTADLSVETDQLSKIDGSSKVVTFSDKVADINESDNKTALKVIDEQKIDLLLQYLHDADPSSDSTDPLKMLELEEQVADMNPLIDSALEKIDKQHAQLTQLSSDAVDAVNLYHSLMRTSATSAFNTPSEFSQQPMNYIYAQFGPQVAPINRTPIQIPSRMPQPSNQVPLQGFMPEIQSQNQLIRNTSANLEQNIIRKDINQWQ